MPRRSASPRWNSLVAAAQVIAAPNAAVRASSVGKPDQWTGDAWDFYDRIGELRFGVSWIANAMSRVNLVAAMPSTEAGSDPIRIDLDDPRTTPGQRRAHELIGMIAHGVTGQGQLLAEFGAQLTMAGVGWLVVEPDSVDPLADSLDNWDVFSSDEIRGRDDVIEVRTGDREWRTLHPNAIVVKVWRKHPRRSWEPDSPVHGVLPVLREIDLLQKHIHATAQSRLAGAGILALPTEAIFPPGQGPQASNSLDSDDENLTAPEDTFVDTLIDAMTTPLADRGSASAVVPLVVKMPGDLVDKVRHITFATPFDERVMELMTQAIKRLALGLDIPPEILTGTSGMNHWGAWQVQEEAITLHIAPMSEMIVNALTVAYLTPVLEAEGFDSSEVVVWYDTSALTTRPDKSKSAVEAYDRTELSGAAMLREMGLNPDDAPDPDEKRERLLLSVARGAPTLAPAMLAELGYLDVADVADAIEVVADARRGDMPTPSTQPDQSPPEPTEPIVSAADILVHRALERAGSRLRSAAGKGRDGGAATIVCTNPATLHTTIRATDHASLDHLLDGAWTLVPELAARHNIDPDRLTEMLDVYARGLLVAQIEHGYERLAAHLR